MGEDLHQKILSVLEGIRPCLKIDGGDIEVADLSDDGFVRLRFLGACSSCPLSPMTLRAGVERTLMLALPEVKRVEQVS
ncbi:MAG: NifU family protein [Bacteroidota bacterium]